MTTNFGMHCGYMSNYKEGYKMIRVRLCGFFACFALLISGSLYAADGSETVETSGIELAYQRYQIYTAGGESDACLLAK